MTTNPRVFLWLALLLLGWINYETWVRDYAPKPKSAAEIAQEAQVAAQRDAQFGASVTAEVYLPAWTRPGLCRALSDACFEIDLHIGRF